MITNYQELQIWKISTNLSIFIYKITNLSDFKKDYSLKDQIRRASISVPSNIAEGFGRNNNNELIQFLKIAKGSACELETQLIISHKIGYINETTVKLLLEEIDKLKGQLGKFISYLASKRRNKEFLSSHK